jgi:hypothetical protein
MSNSLVVSLALGTQLLFGTTNQGPISVSVDPGSAGGVTSVFGRTGAVVAQDNDYAASQITGGMQQVATLAARNAIPLANRQVGQTVYEVDTDQLWRLIGGTANANWIDVTIGPASGTAGGLVPAVGGVSTILQSTGTASAWVSPLSWDSTFLAPTIQHTVTAVNNAVGQVLTVQAQNASTGAASVGGILKLASGLGNAAVGSWQAFAGTTKFVDVALSDANDFIALGAVPATTGTIRLPSTPNGSIFHRSSGVNISVYTADAGSIQRFGSTVSGGTFIESGVGVQLRIGATISVGTSTTIFSLLLPNFLVGAAAAASGFLSSVQDTNSGANAGGVYRIRGMGCLAGAATNGANVEIEGGRGFGTGLSGGFIAKLNVDNTQANMVPMFQLAQLTTTRRILAFNFPGTAGAGVTTTQMGANTGDLVSFFANANTVPTADAASGFIYYGDGGKPGWRYNGVSRRWDGLQTTVGAVGAAAALPALPLGYKTETINGVATATPYYNA